MGNTPKARPSPTRGRALVKRARKTGPSLNLILTGSVIILAIAIGVTIFIVKNSGNSNADSLGHELSAGGADDVEVVEYVDFQCPACYGYYSQVTRELEQEYNGRINLQIRNFPLPMHPLAVPAAKAAEAAAKQGRFADYYHELYDTWPSWATESDNTPTTDEAAARRHFISLARKLDLDTDTFTTDMADPAIADRIEQDIEAGTDAGITSTPTIVIDGEKFEPQGSGWDAVRSELRAAIDAELAE